MTAGSHSELPAELIEAVILEFWYSENSSKDRILFMKSCPLINSLWKEAFARISSRDIYVPTVAYLLYLSTIIRTNSSLIYCSDLPLCARTITCHVDLTETTHDAAMEPYSVLASLPNHSGFRKCFPDIEQMHFEAMTQLSVLPIDWHVIAENPEVDNVRGIVADVHWDIFLREATLAVAPGTLSCIRNVPFKETVLNSTYVGGLLHFRGQALLVERMGDVRLINDYFRKAAPKPSNLWNLIGEAFEDAEGVVVPPGSVYSCWKTILGEASGKRKL
ncbi:hypothetical protein F5146DRAFT_1001419 [Armillaria mellea]|nr:hypothetical protein F5146DRAFT_1001419 [Armillaria mellea]